MHLPLAQRPLRPVGEARGFVDMRAGELAGQRLVADRVAEAADHGRDLGVEQRRRHRAGHVEEDLDVLPRGVEDLEDAGDRPSARTAAPDRCPGASGSMRGGLVRAGDLDQAELRPIGLVAHEFGVDRDEVGLGLAAAEGGEGVAGVDQRHCRAIHRNPGARQSRVAPGRAPAGRLTRSRLPCAFARLSVTATG